MTEAEDREPQGPEVRQAPVPLFNVSIHWAQRRRKTFATAWAAMGTPP
jgi:hypothetical protein